MKKGLAILLTLIMLFTMQSVTASAASFADTLGESCEAAVDVLSELGIVEGKAEGAYEPNGALTRAEMTTIILRTIGMADTAEGIDIFEDVSFVHWAYGNITTAYQMGIVQGTSATTFDPDATVTRDQAVKMVIATLGYSVAAEAMGGYPSGYLTKATQLGLLDGVASQTDMTRGDMAILMYNALDTPLFEKTAYGDDSFEYGSNEDATLLTRYLKVEKMTGKVVQTPMALAMSPLPGASSSKILSDEVRVFDGTTTTLMKVGQSSAQKLLGIRSEFFYRKDEITGKAMIVAAVPRTSAKTLDVAVKDVVASKTTATELVYEKDNVEKRESIAGATLVYNGKVVPMNEALLKPEIGTLRLISEAGGTYNLVVVESYTNYLVDRVDLDNDVIYFKNGAGSMLVNLSDSDINTLITDKAGKVLALNNLDEWDVLSIYSDDDMNPTIRRIYSARENVDGKVLEYSGTAQEIVIGETSYPVSSTVTIDSSLPSGPVPGALVVAYLDFTGTIFYMEASKGSGRIYGWLKGAETTTGLDPVTQLKIFTQDGQWKVFKVAEKVQLNDDIVRGTSILENGKPATEYPITGVSGGYYTLDKSAGTAGTMFEEGTAPTLVDSTGAIEPQLIAYEVNEEGVITKIETAYNLTKPNRSEEDVYGGTFSMDYFKSRNLSRSIFDNTTTGLTPSDAYYGNNVFQKDAYAYFVNNVLAAKIRIRPETKYFVIPGNADKEDAYQMKTATAEIVLSTTGTNHDLDCLALYDVSEEYVCGAAVLRKDIIANEKEGGGGPGESAITYPDASATAGVVLSRGKTLDADGMVVDALKVYDQNGQEVALNLANIDRVLYRNANANMWTYTLNGVTYEGDPDWYMLKEDGTKYQPAKNTNDWKYYGYSGSTKISATRHNEIFIDVEDIVPGDVVQYIADDDGNLSRLLVVLRSEYPGNVEFTARPADLKASGPDSVYNGGNLSSYGQVQKVLNDAFVVKVNLPEMSTEVKSYSFNAYTYGLPLIQNIDGVDQFLTTTRVMPKLGKFVLWDTASQEMREISAANLSVGDTVFVWWSLANQRMVVVYR